MKKFTIPCDFGGKKAPFDVYIGEPDEGNHPLQYQAQWLASERGGTIPGEVMESFSKLLALSKKNNVSFEDLCVYALEAANEEKKKKSNPDKSEEAKLGQSFSKDKLKGNEANLKDTKQVLNNLTTIIEKGNAGAMDYNRRGFVYISLGMYELALKDLKIALKIDQNLADAHSNIGFVYLRLNDFKNSLIHLTNSSKINSTNPYLYRNFGHYYMSKNDNSKALAFFKKAIELNFTKQFGSEVEEIINGME